MKLNCYYKHLINGEVDETKKKKTQIPAGMKRLEPVEPRSDYYHYSNPDSQGALICECGNCDWYNGSEEEYSCAYSDRLQGWDAKHYTETCKLAGTGEQGWAYRLPSLSEQELKEFAQHALKLPVLPRAVRVTHWFNVSNGYSCPSIEAIYTKTNKE